jgi:hypothetical protein
MSKGTRKSPLYNTFWMKICRNTLKWLAALKRYICYQGLPRAPVGGNDCFSLASYNDWHRCWELNSLSLCTIHLFRFMCEDGGEEGILDVLVIEGCGLGICSHPPIFSHNLKSFSSYQGELLVVNVTTCIENH